MTNASTLHRTEFFAWTKEQAEALRAAGHAASIPGTNRALDWENLAEEVESLGKSQRDALASQIERVLRHLAKLEFLPAEPPRGGWRRSIREGRVRIARILRDNPSLRAEIESIAQVEHHAAIKLALGDLDDHGEASLADRRALADRRYDVDTEVLSTGCPRGSRVGLAFEAD